MEQTQVGQSSMKFTFKLCEPSCYITTSCHFGRMQFLHLYLRNENIGFGFKFMF